MYYTMFMDSDSAVDVSRCSEVAICRGISEDPGTLDMLRRAIQHRLDGLDLGRKLMAVPVKIKQVFSSATNDVLFCTEGMFSIVGTQGIMKNELERIWASIGIAGAGSSTFMECGIQFEVARTVREAINTEWDRDTIRKNYKLYMTDTLFGMGVGKVISEVIIIRWKTCGPQTRADLLL
jgi:hypothetical protein